MKWVFLVASLAGCASGQTNAGISDADTSVPGIDAKEYLDGSIEGHPDARPDARPDAPPDARPDAPPDAYVCTTHVTQLLVNPALDLSPTTGWTQQNIDNAYPIIGNAGLAPHSAPNKAWMGGIVAPVGTNVTDQLYQDVTIPMGTSSLVLTYQYVVGTQETGTTVYDRGYVDLLKTDGTPLESAQQLTNATTNSAWAPFTKTFTGNYAGQTVRLRFTSTNDDLNVTNFFFDTIALTATYCQ
jgi:hypothetical protein